ncbi:hypothetical protein [Dictyoglomus sp.]|uniref:hypothetical protein n=1 Tax=Dictyoglomus sp. TaxID=28205 RepID=UPI003D146C22
MVRKIFISILLFVILLPFSSNSLAQDSCKDSLSIADLKERLIKLKKIREGAEKGIIDSDRIMMKAQEIILLARARGDTKAGQVAEEALRRAEKSKNEHRKNKEEAEKEILILEQYINTAKQNGLNCMKDVCNKYREQVDRDKIVLKRFLEEAERRNKEWEERLKEVEKEIIEYYADLASNLLPAVSAYLKADAIAKLKVIISEEVLKNYSNPVITKRWIEAYNNYEKALQHVNALENISLTIDSIRYVVSELQIIKHNIDQAETELRAILSDPEFKVYLSETGQFGAGLILDRIKEILEGNPETLITNPRIGIINAISRGQIYANLLVNIPYHGVKITLMDEEIDREYKLTDEQLKALNTLTDQNRKTMQKVKDCEEYSKKYYDKNK